jgi:hypothetical protein
MGAINKPTLGVSCGHNLAVTTGVLMSHCVNEYCRSAVNVLPIRVIQIPLAEVMKEG